MRLRIFDRYIGGQILFTTIFGVVVLCFVLVLGNIFKEMLPRLVESQVSLGYFFRFILYVLPFSLVFTIPWGFLTAVLLVFGRLSADSEMVSMRMSGLSATRICLPVFVIGVVLTALCLYINVSVAPKAKNSIEEMLYNMATQNPDSLMQADQVISAFPNRFLYFREREGEYLKDLSIIETEGASRPVRYIQARRGIVKPDLEALDLRVMLEDSYIMIYDTESRLADGAARVMNFRRLEMPSLDLSELVDQRVRPSAMTNGELRQFLATEEDVESGLRNSMRAEMSKRYSFSLACITFGLIGIPLGITAQRRETSIGFSLSLAVAFSYFLFIVIGDTFSGRSGPLPHILMWLPNVIFISLGIYLFRKLNRK